MQKQNRARGRSHQEMRHHQQTTPSRTNIIRSEHCQINTSHQIEMEFTLIEFSPSARVYMFRSQSSLYASNRIMIMNNFYFISFNIHLKYGRMEVGKTCIRLPINRMAQTKSFNSLVEQLVGEAQNTTKRNSHTSINDEQHMYPRTFDDSTTNNARAMHTNVHIPNYANNFELGNYDTSYKHRSVVNAVAK